MSRNFPSRFKTFSTGRSTRSSNCPGHRADVARLLIGEILEEDAQALAGEGHSRNGPSRESLQGCGYNPGSIRVGGGKVPIDIPRLQDKDEKEEKEEHTLESYQAMKEAEMGKELTNSILLGLSPTVGKGSRRTVGGYRASLLTASAWASPQ